MAQEASAQVFYRDLFTLARELERGGEDYLAQQIFHGLSLEREISPSLRLEAQAFAAAIAGEGPWNLRLERSASRFLQEVSSPELLVGMGAGSLGFGLGRVMGLSFLRGMGIRGSTAVVSGRLLGLATEATTFTLASRSVARFTGRSSEGIFDHFATHWASAALMMGTLRVTGWGVQKLLGPLAPTASPLQNFGYQSAQQGAMYLGLLGNAYAAEKIGWTPERSWDAILAASAAELVTFQVAGRLSRQIFHPSLGSLERRLELEALRGERGALRPPTLVQGAFDPGFLPMVFNMGSDNGGSSGGSGNKGRSPVPRRDQTLTFETENLGLPGDPRRAESLLTIMRRIREKELKFEEEILDHDVPFTIEGLMNLKDPSSLENLVSILNSATRSIRLHPETAAKLKDRRVIIVLEPNPAIDRPNSKVIRIPFEDGEFKVPYRELGFRDSAPKPPLEPQNPPRRARNDDSLPGFQTHLGKVGRELEFESFIQLTRRIMEKRDEFQEALVQENMVVRLKWEMGWNLDNLLRMLNFNLPRLGEIPEMRRINLSIGEGTEKISVVVLKNEGAFVAPFEPTRMVGGRATPVGREPKSTPQRTPRKTPVREGAPPSARDSQEGLANLNAPLSAKDLPYWVLAPENLMRQLRRVLSEQGGEATPVFILENRSLALAELQALTEKITGSFPEGLRWELLVPDNPEGRKTFSGESREGRVQWRLGNQEPWNRASRQAIFDTAVVRSPAEIYQHLQAMAAHEGRGENSVIHLKQKGEVSQEYLDALGPALTQMLKHFELNRSSLLLISETGKTLLGLQKQHGQWTLVNRGETPSVRELEGRDSDRPTELPPIPQATASVGAPRNFSLVRIPTQLIQHWKVMLDPLTTKSRLDLLVRFDEALSPKDELGFQRDLMGLPEGRQIALHDIPGKQTLTLRMEGGKLQVRRAGWEKPPELNPLSVSDPVDFFHQLAFVAESPSQGRILKATTTQRWPENDMPLDFLETLSTFRDLPYRELRLIWRGDQGASMKRFSRRRLSGWQEG
ncbi:MAG: hypothetical protein R3257_00970 [bacterium]|nr:hypothetical protein [bacterium]